MNTSNSSTPTVFASATADAHDIDPKMKDEQLRQSVEVDSDAYTDDEGYESSPRGVTSPNGMGTGVWSKEEHTKFLEAIEIYANGPWKLVAAYVGTRTVRQTMTHAQKYRQKAARRLRGLRTKQALMLMHFGHHVSAESLIQERLRSMGTANNANYPHLACEPLPIARSIGIPPHSRNSCRVCAENLPSGTIESEATPLHFSSSSACLDSTLHKSLTVELSLYDASKDDTRFTINNVNGRTASTCPPRALCTPDGRRHSRRSPSQLLSMGVQRAPPRSCVRLSRMHTGCSFDKVPASELQTTLSTKNASIQAPKVETTPKRNATRYCGSSIVGWLAHSAFPMRQATPQYSSNKPSAGVGMWTEEEHARFLEGVKLFSNGPWKRVAAYVGTRNVRQTMTHAQKYRLKAARRLREAQRKQAAARHGLHNAHRGIAVDSALAQRTLQTPSSAGGLGLGSYSKMRLPCSCTEKDCPHMDDASKIYMSIADAIEILDSKSSIVSIAGSPVSTDDTLGNTWLNVGTFDPVIKMAAFGKDDLIHWTLQPATLANSRRLKTVPANCWNCSSELLHYHSTHRRRV
ncbi:Myb domain [Phytophthora cactorum]|nr:Myb domain [Phytophthora cactorum]